MNIKECPKCLGTGIERETAKNNRNRIDYEKRQCKKCNGTGLVHLIIPTHILIKYPVSGGLDWQMAPIIQIA